MTDIGSALKTYKKQVAVAGTRVQLESSGGGSFATKTIVIQALSTNTGEIVVGDEGVLAETGTQPSPKRLGIALAAKNIISIDINDAAQIWLDATVSKDGVSYVVLQA